MLEVMEEKEKDVYLADFAKISTAAFPFAWLQRTRQSAIARFGELGFPTLRDEEWRFTNVAPIARIPFRRSTPTALTQVNADALAPFIVDGIRLVFVNGHFSKSLSTTAGLPAGVSACALSAASEKESKLIEANLAKHACFKDQVFVALNTAFIEDGAFIHIPKGLVLETPIQLIFASTSAANGQPVVSHPRNLIVAEESSQATIIESYIGIGGSGGASYFTNAVTELVAGKNAVVDHYKAQQESLDAFHVATIQILQDKSSTVSSTSVSLGGAIVRNNVNAVLNAEGCECTLNGLYMVDGQQLVDNHTMIDHAKPHCNSHELYKGILSGKSKGVFNGKIFVRPDAQKTDAKQTNKALLLSDDATINTQPMLKIYADDVKCTHGATIGQLDKQQLFYLRSRAIGESEALGILTFAFANDIVHRIKEKGLQHQLEKALSKILNRPMDLLDVDGTETGGV